MLQKISFTLLIISTLVACNSTPKTSKLEENMDGDFLFIGTYTRTEGHVDGKGEGIYVYQWDSIEKVLTHHMTIDGIINPSYITLHPMLPIVYAVSEIADGTDTSVGEVHAIQYDLAKKHFNPLSILRTGDAPCHISMTADYKYLLVASYVEGSVSSFAIQEDGSFKDAADIAVNVKTTPTTPRQEAAHAHMIRPIPKSNNVLVADLGTDELITFGLDNKGTFTKKHAIISQMNGGPRHFDFHPTLPFVYVLNELKPSITSFLLADGIPQRKIQHLDLPIKNEGDLVNSSAIKMHPDGTALYAAVRGLNGSPQNEIVVVSVDGEGRLSIIQTIYTEGDIPRDFTISPCGNFLIAGNQNSDNIAVFRIHNDKKLSLISSDTKVPTPVSFDWK